MGHGRVLFESLRKSALAPTARDKTSNVDPTRMITIFSDLNSGMRGARLPFPSVELVNVILSL